MIAETTPNMRPPGWGGGGGGGGGILINKVLEQCYVQDRGTKAIDIYSGTSLIRTEESVLIRGVS